MVDWVVLSSGGVDLANVRIEFVVTDGPGDGSELLNLLEAAGYEEHHRDRRLPWNDCSVYRLKEIANPHVIHALRKGCGKRLDWARLQAEASLRPLAGRETERPPSASSVFHRWLKAVWDRAEDRFESLRLQTDPVHYKAWLLKWAGVSGRGLMFQEGQGTLFSPRRLVERANPDLLCFGGLLNCTTADGTVCNGQTGRSVLDVDITELTPNRILVKLYCNLPEFFGGAFDNLIAESLELFGDASAGETPPAVAEGQPQRKARGGRPRKTSLTNEEYAQLQAYEKRVSNGTSKDIAAKLEGHAVETFERWRKFPHPENTE